MRIHQLNLRYDNDQDRVVARINTDTGQELRLWFTRRLTLGLLPLLRKLVAQQVEQQVAQDATQGQDAAKDPMVRQVLSDFKKEQALRQSDFKTPFKEPAAGLALTEAPLLVAEVAMTPLAHNRLQAKFRGVPDANKQRKEMQLELDSQLMLGFLHLLEQAYANSQWGLAHVAPMDAEPDTQVATQPIRPQYLN